MILCSMIVYLINYIYIGHLIKNKVYAYTYGSVILR